jgi:EpsI family protein
MMATGGKNLLIGLVMILAFWVSYALKPKPYAVDPNSKVVLESMIPKEFLGWKVDEAIVPVQVDPQRLELQNKIYNQTLSRTYFNEHGDRVMLSIAYGGDMSDSMQVHRPEVCYAAQGFSVDDVEAIIINTGFGNISSRKLIAKMGNRNEPIIYWITIGDTASLSRLEWKIQTIKYALTGKVAGGILFRVSSIGEKNYAYQLEQNFVIDLMKSISPENRKRLIGSKTI